MTPQAARLQAKKYEARYQTTRTIEGGRERDLAVFGPVPGLRAERDMRQPDRP